MASLESIVAPALVFVSLVPLVAAGGLDFESATGAGVERAAIEVTTDRFDYNRGDTVRFVIRSVGPGAVEGTPKVWLMNDQAVPLQVIPLEAFDGVLSAGEEVRAELKTAPPAADCPDVDSGAEDVKGLPPCPGSKAGGEGAATDGSDAGTSTSGLWSATFVVLVVAGDHADATSFRLH
ncbi:MAG: hypothetical protein HYT80_06340 [Euryarchaeota archaeon]|nr:hypothetical protein [Euryarchaeota archaeon]